MERTGGHVPKPKPLLSGDSREALYQLLKEIRGCDTTRELRLHLRRAVEFQRDVRDFSTRIETDVLAKLEEILDWEDEDLVVDDDLARRREEREEESG